jgi:hypothetical protein
VGAVGGGLVGSLVGLGIPEFEAKRYENEVKEGLILLVVEAEDDAQADMVGNIFERGDAHHISA